MGPTGDNHPGDNSSSRRRGSEQSEKKTQQSQQLPPVGGGPNYGSKAKATEEKANAGAKKGGKSKKEGLKSAKVCGIETDDEVWFCKRCKKEFADQNDKIMECDCCEEHVCFECLKINDDQYETMKRDDLFWTCNNKCRRVITNAMSLSDTLSKYDMIIKKWPTWNPK